jgi:hypothetical protein
MTNFDMTINKVEEHCKVGKYFAPFNNLQVKILDRLYFNHIKDVVEGFDDDHIKNIDQLLDAYIEYLYPVVSYLGDVMCKKISNYKTINYTTNDIDRWASMLYNTKVKDLL